MACGCKGGNRNPDGRGKQFPRNQNDSLVVAGGGTGGAGGLRQTKPQTPSPNGMDAARRAKAADRRAAIKKALNKG